MYLAGGISPRFLFGTVFTYYGWRWRHISKDLRINEEIRVREVRLVGETGEQFGIYSIKDALREGMEKGLDLVEVAPNAKPPVCRLMDYGKYRYEQSKRERESRKKQKIITVKEVKIRPKIDDHDLEFKTKNAERFLKEGDKVKVTVMFRGREITRPALGKALCERMAELLKDTANVEKEAKLEGRNMIMILAPKPDSERAQA